ncbi:PA2169 family four-helix-bundle protein [Algoriphagus sp. D3-2-R+10]|uniref:ferritin-like domain-containing protein n=1 Tax=Algoriphagus aurantiacus TaxID=3103948 RepID=UPI002B3EDF0A|nr:PA2169 family four-helix-bundle protein [Algoriphagus sp. D3-2-R+10]MEB2778167.1 PA2169 family four-helix-bundle protein [Algoriphagus sp. D3-2-R+10]
MNTTDKSAEILNDLVEINNDRIEGYEKAIENLKQEDNDLKPLFVSLIGESQKCRLALSNELNVLKTDTEQGYTTSGKLYRAWMDVKAVFTGHDRKSVLENCEFGEDAAQKAYKDAANDEDLPAHLKELVNSQKATLKQSHDKIKMLRDQVA